MKSPDLRGLDESGLTQHIRDQRKEVFGLRFRHATGELENTAALRFAKRDVARAITVARGRGLDTNSPSTVRSATNG